MRAAVLNRAGDLDLDVRDDVEAVDPGSREVQVRIMASGVCHSDLSAVQGSLWIPVPAVMGHEGAGVIERVGDEVPHLKPGDHVVIAVSMACGTCETCTALKSPHLCSRLFFDVAGKARFTASGTPLAAMGAIGCLAEVVTVPMESVVVIPEDVPFDVAALLGCGVTSGLGAVLNTARVTPHSSVVVLGLGGVGIAALQGAQIAGADVIVAVDTVPARLSLARTFGSTHACTPEDLDTVAKELTYGGFDYSFEATGNATAMRQAYDAVRRGGTACVIGAGPESEKVVFSASEIYYNEKRFMGSYHGSADFGRDVHRFLDFWRSGSLDLTAMITHRFGIQDVNKAFRLMRNGIGIRSIVVSS
jgi:S-(hydroxymethyl)glutathione dehydrogenase / alcohol dehydrogenase